MRDVAIVEAVRAPVGKRNGSLSNLLPVHLAARVLKELIARAQIDPALIEDVVFGCVTALSEQGANIARLAVLQAGLPIEAPAVTLNRMCGSGQQAIHFAAQAIASGDMDVVIAGGIEMMSHQPLGADYPPRWPEDFPYELVHQGTSAEMMAEKWGLEREALDDFAYQSHLRAMQAIQAGHFESQILPVVRPDGRLVTTDEGVRMPPDREKMRSLKPVFK